MELRAGFVADLLSQDHSCTAEKIRVTKEKNQIDEKLEELQLRQWT